MVPYGPVWSLWSPLVLYGPLWSHMVPYSQVWSPMVPYGPVLSHMVPYGSVLSCMVLFDHLLSPLVTYCYLWSPIVYIFYPFHIFTLDIPSWGKQGSLSLFWQPVDKSHEEFSQTWWSADFLVCGKLVPGCLCWFIIPSMVATVWPRLQIIFFTSQAAIVASRQALQIITGY